MFAVLRPDQKGYRKIRPRPVVGIAPRLDQAPFRSTLNATLGASRRIKRRAGIQPAACDTMYRIWERGLLERPYARSSLEAFGGRHPPKAGCMHSAGLEAMSILWNRR